MTYSYIIISVITVPSEKVTLMFKPLHLIKMVPYMHQ